jgi:hypothetical protein
MKGDPRMMAREDIKKRQVLIDENASDGELRLMDPPAITKKLNEAIADIDETNDKERRVKSIRKLTNGGIIMEMGNAESARWIQRDEIAEKFIAKLKIAVTFKKWLYNTIAFFVPLTFNPDSEANMEELAETNNTEANIITKAKWAKPPERRHPTQRSGHLLISFSDPEIANRAILDGLIICNKRVKIQKCKKEPLRCLKCHRWNHVAANCDKDVNVCGTCGNTDHQTRDCQNKETQRCISCGTNNHPSWDWNCPTFLKKCEEQNTHLLENNMPFFPTQEPWTWAKTPPPTHLAPVAQAPSFLDCALRPPHKKQLQQTQLPYHSQANANERWGMAITKEGESNVWHRGHQTTSGHATGPNATPIERSNRIAAPQSQSHESGQTQANNSTTQ